MYIVQWCDHEGNLQKAKFERLREANAEARALRQSCDEVRVIDDSKPKNKGLKIPEFLRAALETGRMVRIFVTNGYQMEGVITDVDVNLRTITLDSEDGERLVFMNAISTII